MSKIGQLPIMVPPTVKTEIRGNQILIKGEEGEIIFNLPNQLVLNLENNQLIIKRKRDDGRSRSLHGLYRSLINNAILGVERPWQRRLEVVGTGYNVRLQGKDLIFKLGYSHPVVFKKTTAIRYVVEGDNKIVVSGVDKQLVGQVAYQIKMLKKPDAYKGKGIRYEGEKVKTKPGKKLKVTTAV